MSAEPGPSSAISQTTPVTAITTSLAGQTVKAHEEVSVSPISTSHDQVRVGQPTEQLEVDEAATVEDTTIYPTGSKLWLNYIVLLLSLFLNGLDIAIVAVAIPSLTDEFNTIADIGWYSAAFGLVYSSSAFFFGKCYTVFKTKHVYLFGLVVFETGSLICTFAKSSKMFVVGRAVAAFGGSAFGGGLLKILRELFPMSKQAFAVGIAGAAQCVGLVSAPMLGGLLIGAFSWRACFGINVPLGVITIVVTAWTFTELNQNPDTELPIKEKLKRLDLIGSGLIIPSIMSLMLGLQWGGIKYGWKDARIIALFIVFASLFTAFAYLQYRQGDNATVPPRLIKKRSILGAMWFSSCLNGILAMTEYYISIYFQGVRGFTAAKSGVLGVPLLVGVTLAFPFTSYGINKIGYYFPFLFITSIIAPIASGLLTTVDLDGTVAKPSALLGLLGFAVGMGFQGPPLAVQTTCSTKDVSIGSAIVASAGGLGSAMWICISATMFQDRLRREIHHFSPSSNVTAIETAGLSQIRTVIGSDSLRNVLSGYNEAVVQTLYLPVALAVLTIIGTLAMERNSIKKKQE